MYIYNVYIYNENVYMSACTYIQYIYIVYVYMCIYIYIIEREKERCIYVYGYNIQYVCIYICVCMYRDNTYTGRMIQLGNPQVSTWPQKLGNRLRTRKT